MREAEERKRTMFKHSNINWMHLKKKMLLWLVRERIRGNRATERISEKMRKVWECEIFFFEYEKKTDWILTEIFMATACA